MVRLRLSRPRDPLRPTTFSLRHRTPSARDRAPSQPTSGKHVNPSPVVIPFRHFIATKPFSCHVGVTLTGVKSELHMCRERVACWPGSVGCQLVVDGVHKVQFLCHSQ